MGQKNKPEVYLEVCTGFFRIPTDTVNYNITVMNSGVGAVPAVSSKVEPVASETSGQIDSVDDLLEQVDFSEDSSVPATYVEDNFYKLATLHFSGEFGRLTANLSTEGPHDEKHYAGGEAVKHLNDLQELVGETKKSLEELTQISVSAPEESPGANSTELFEGLKGNVVKAKELVAEIAAAQISQAAAVAEPPAPKVEKVKKRRYLFDLDIIFQTIYELCTNETVKEHSQAARAKAADIFNLDTFLDAISPKAAKYVEDDGFYSVPMADVFSSLVKACSDKKTINLLKNMNKQQADIFLDQFLPLSIPPTEDIEVEVEAPPAAAAQVQAVAPQESDPRFDQVIKIMDSVLGELDKLAAESGEDKQTPSVPTGLAEKVSAAVGMVEDIDSAIQAASEDLGRDADQQDSGVSYETNRGLQDAAMKMASCIVMKEENPDLSFYDALGGNIVLPDTVEEVQVDLPEEVDDLPEFEPEADEELAETLNENDELLETLADLEEDSLAAEADDGEFEVEEEPLTVTDEPQDSVVENEVPEALASEPAEDDDIMDEDDFGEASQDDIDKLLESMGG